MASLISIVATLLALSGIGVRGVVGQDSSASTALETTDLQPLYFGEYGAKRTKIVYGTYTVPGASTANGMLNDQIFIPLPCSDCLVTWIKADLEYENGTVADADSGLWLHHMVITSLTKKNILCPKNEVGDFFFASGNERTIADLSHAGHSKTAYYVNATDSMLMTIDLMNTNEVSASVRPIVTWEHVPARTADFQYLMPHWLDIASCHASDMPSEASAVFNYTSDPFSGFWPGRMSSIFGHLHDGGTRIDIKKNGKVVCSISPGYQTGVGPDGADFAHISSMTNCSENGFTSNEDQWTIEAFYDTAKHVPMLSNSGSLEPVMGIALLYVAYNRPDSTDNFLDHYLVSLAAVVAVILLVTAAAFSVRALQKRRVIRLEGRAQFPWLQFGFQKDSKHDKSSEEHSEEESHLLTPQ